MTPTHESFMKNKPVQQHSKLFTASLVVLILASVYYTQSHTWPIFEDIDNGYNGKLASLLIEAVAIIMWYRRTWLWGATLSTTLILIPSFNIAEPILIDQSTAKTNEKLIEIERNDRKLLGNMIGINNDKKKFPSLTDKQYKSMREQSRKLQELILKNGKLELSFEKKVKIAFQLLILFVIFLSQIILISIVSDQKDFWKIFHKNQRSQENLSEEYSLEEKSTQLMKRVKHYMQFNDFRFYSQAADALNISSSRISELKARINGKKGAIDSTQMKNMDIALQKLGF